MLHGSSWFQNVLILSTVRYKQYLKLDLSLKVPDLLTLGHIFKPWNTSSQTYKHKVCVHAFRCCTCMITSVTSLSGGREMEWVYCNSTLKVRCNFFLSKSLIFSLTLNMLIAVKPWLLFVYPNDDPHWVTMAHDPTHLCASTLRSVDILNHICLVLPRA